MKFKKTITSLACLALLGAGIKTWNWLREQNKDYYKKVQPIGLIYSDEKVREYAGIARIFKLGTEQEIYVDRKPFGSLDAVKTTQWSQSTNYLGTLKERMPWPGEDEAFLILQELGKEEHPARYEFEELKRKDQIRPKM